MIQALDRNDTFLLRAYLIKRGDELQPAPIPNPTNGIYFRCRLASEMNDQDEYGVKNVLSHGNRVKIETLNNFRLGGKNLVPHHDDLVFFEDMWFVVDSVAVEEYDKKEKTLGLSRMKYGNIKYTISLVEIAVAQ